MKPLSSSSTSSCLAAVRLAAVRSSKLVLRLPLRGPLHASCRVLVLAIFLFTTLLLVLYGSLSYLELLASRSMQYRLFRTGLLA